MPLEPDATALLRRRHGHCRLGARLKNHSDYETSTGQWPGKTSTADYSQDNFATQTCKNSPIFPRQHHYQSSSPPSSKNMCHISGLDLNLHFLKAVCRSESGNAVTSRPVSVQILLFPARAIGTGTHTRPVNHPRPRHKRGSVHPRARRSDIASHPPPLTRDAIGHPNSNNIIAIISLPRLPMPQFFSIQGSPSTISAVPSPGLTQKTSLDLHTIDHVHDAINTEPRIPWPMTEANTTFETQHRRAASSTLGHTTH